MANKALRAEIAEAIPLNLRNASSVGIGLFLTVIGLKNSGIIVSDPLTLVRLGHFGAATLSAIVLGLQAAPRDPRDALGHRGGFAGFNAS